MTIQIPNQLELTILMPCLNEAETLEACITKAFQYIRDSGIHGEVLVADNGSTDGSQDFASSLNARVINVAEKGYGSALMGGIENAKGIFVIMGDADDSYNFSEIEPILEKLRDKYSLVMGNRFKGGIEPGAMPFLHRYLGNPVLSAIARLFFGGPIRDFHCGLRGFNRNDIISLRLQTTGMEFASELVIKAILTNLSVIEVPIKLYPDGRSRKPHLRTWRDGWRHLRFMLLYSPRWLFFYPGIFLFLAGLIGFIFVLPGPLLVGGVEIDVHSLLVSAGFLIIGSETIMASFLANQYASNEGLLLGFSSLANVRKKITMEWVVLVGALLVALGISLFFVSFVMWGKLSFGPLDYSKMMRIVIPSITSFVIGFQVILHGFLSSILALNFRTGKQNGTIDV